MMICVSLLQGKFKTLNKKHTKKQSTQSRLFSSSALPIKSQFGLWLLG